MAMIEKDQKPNANTPNTPNTPSGNMPAGNGTLDFQAVAKQYGLQATKENVDAFMLELTAYEKNGTLGPGANAPEDIKELQGALSRWGYSVQVNGQYDDATCQAIIKFKKDNGLNQSYRLADGSLAVNEYAGPDTLTKILAKIDKELAEQKNKPVQPSQPVAPQATQPATAPVQTTETDPQVAAIAKQYGLLANKANIDAFLKEVGDYEKNGALGPGANATADVKELQQILKGWGFSIDVNGQYDQKTSAAILGFKQQNGIHQSYKLADGNFAVNEYADQATLVKILEKVGK
jgi:peptidoglycan hydrolase-like protein with peptidoglycan-binding domain